MRGGFRNWFRRGGWRYLLRGVALAMLGAVFVLYQTVDDLRDLAVDDDIFGREIARAAAFHGLDPLLVRAVVFQESRFNPGARGGKGEIGLMQLWPRGAVADWARVHRVEPPNEAELFDVGRNLDIGCWFLARGMRRWSDYRCGTELALAQYNAGESRAERWKPASPEGEVVSAITIESTRHYVGRIMKRYRKYREEQ